MLNRVLMEQDRLWVSWEDPWWPTHGPAVKSTMTGQCGQSHPPAVQLLCTLVCKGGCSFPPSSPQGAHSSHSLGTCSDTRIQCQVQARNLLKLQSQIVTEGNREWKLFHYSPRLTESLLKSLSFSAPFLCYFLVSTRHCQNREIIYRPSALKRKLTAATHHGKGIIYCNIHLILCIMWKS